MFSWKRPRKEEEPPAPRAAPRPPACPQDMAVECSPLGTSPAAVVAAAGGLLPIGSGASSVCSEPEEECTELAAPGSSGSSSSVGMGGEGAAGAAASSSCSIELASLPAQQQQQALQQQGPAGVPACGSVRAKAAYFEALVRCNTTAHIQCCADGAAHCSTSGGLGGDADMRSNAGDWEHAQHAQHSQHAHQPAQQAQLLELSCAGPSSSGGGGQDGGQEGWADFSEVHMVLRMPRAAAPPPPGGGKYGSVGEMEELIEQLQSALELKERQRKAAVDAYTRRSGECDNLMRVVRELTESRSKAACQRASLAERYADLQQEYHRMLRIADLSRTVSKENMAKTSRTRTELRRVQLELHATKSHAQHLAEKQKKARVENALLKEKLTLLERFDFEEVHESECKKHFTRYRLAETY